MRFYTHQHKYYCGIDLHTRKMYICILDEKGEIREHRNLKTDRDTFLKAIAPFREDIVVAVECIFTWYWVADLCHNEGIPFVLGHALYMKAIHGGKAKNDKIDSQKIAVLLRGGMMPMAYVYPVKMRATRDLMRRRNHLIESAPNYTPTSRIPTVSTTCLIPLAPSQDIRTGTALPGNLNILPCRKALPWILK